MISHLGDYFEFFVITRNTDYCLDEPYQSVKSNSWNKIDQNTNVYYISNDSLSIKNLKKIVNGLDSNVLMVNGIYSWYFSILPVLLFSKKMQLIVSARGMLNPQAFSIKAKRKRFFLKVSNLIGLYKKVSFHATNKMEANFIKEKINAYKDIKIASNLPRKIIQSFSTSTEKSNPVRFISVGRVSVEKGTLKTINAFKGVNSEIIFDIFGPIYNEDYWRKCKEAIIQLPKNVVVNYKGVLESDEVLKTLSYYDFFILFSEGENFGHVILEALSVGLPVIISDKTPWESLEKKNIGWDLNTDNDEKVMDIIKQAISLGDESYSKMARSAQNFAIEFSNKPELIEQNKNLFKD